MESTLESPDRVSEQTAPAVNEQIEQQTLASLRANAAATSEELSRNIDRLDREWDIERVLQTNASILALTGVVLGAAVNRKFLAVPGVVLGFFLQHALQGWCPPIPVFRRMGIRTRKEINREKYALKAMRGDFDALGSGAQE